MMTTPHLETAGVTDAAFCGLAEADAVPPPPA